MFRLRGRPKDCVVSEETKGRARRRLAAVLVAGLRPLFPGDERGSFARLQFCLTEIIVPLVSQFDGSIFKQTGDLVLSEFGSVVEAVRSAAALREAMVRHNQNLPNEQRIAMRIGINLGDVIAEGGDILGDGVNIAARLEALAEPGSIFVSGTVHHHIADKVDFEFEDLGRQELKNISRPVRVMVDLYCASYPVPPAAVTLDIDDTVDVVHGHQQLSFFNAHYDERCFLPIHVYDTATARPVAVLLRPGKTPSGKEVRGHLRRLVQRIRKHWPQTHITIRGDGHYSRPEVMAWCEENGIGFIFGLPGNTILDRLVDEAADDIRTRRALEQKSALRGFAETRYQAKSWNKERRVCARIEATTKGLDIRFVITSIHTGSAEHVYETLYCARGQAENLIKLHKAQLASDRTSCRSPLANQMRLILHTAAYWLILTMRDAIPATHALATAEFTTIRLRLLKLGTRVIETASRVRLAFAAACPEAALFRHIAAALMPAGP